MFSRIASRSVRATARTLTTKVVKPTAPKLALITTAAISAAVLGATITQNEAQCAWGGKKLPVNGIAGTNKERTFLAVKPDGVQRGLVGDIIARLEKRGYKLVGLKMVWPSEQMAKDHYGM